MKPPIGTYPEQQAACRSTRRWHGLADWWRLIGCWLLVMCQLPVAAQPSWKTFHDCCLLDRPLKQVDPGTWIWEGQAAEISAANRGHVASNAVLLGHNQVLVVDPGPSLAHGRQLRQAIRCQMGREVNGVINTHAHAENVLGNAAFSATSLWIGATADTASAMRQRCPDCLASLTVKAGLETMAGTSIVHPQRMLSDGQVLDLGTQQWQLLDQRMAHAESHLVLWNAQTRTLIAGGLVYMNRLPELAQGSLPGWIEALQHLANKQPLAVIGTGLGTAADINATKRYLCDLASAVWDGMDAGWSANQAAALELPVYAGWAGYQERQSFNAQRAWRELEPLWMANQPRPCASMPDIGR